MSAPVIMYLEKWYADMVVDGRVQLRYLATLRWGPLSVAYSGEVGQARKSEVKFGSGRQLMPRILGDRLHWPEDSNAPADVWRNAHSRPISLWDRNGRTVAWDPIVLNGAIQSHANQSARGYAERLTLNVAPWHLGLDKLKWGRFCGREHSLVWIEWQGRFPKKIAMLDGRADMLVRADRTEIRTRDSLLVADSPHEIVSEPLGSGALEALGWIRMLAAKRFLSGIETKWVAEAKLVIHEGIVDEGYAVYEEVEWI